MMIANLNSGHELLSSMVGSRKNKRHLMGFCVRVCVCGPCVAWNKNWKLEIKLSLTAKPAFKFRLK